MSLPDHAPCWCAFNTATLQNEQNLVENQPVRLNKLINLLVLRYTSVTVLLVYYSSISWRSDIRDIKALRWEPRVLDVEKML